MKKAFLFLISLFAMLLVSCNNTNTSNSHDNYFTYDGLSPKMIENNVVNPNDKLDVINNYAISSIIDSNEYNIYNDKYLQFGLLVLTEGNNIRFYSLYINDYIGDYYQVGTRYVIDARYNYIASMGFYLYIYEYDKKMISYYDAFGNLLLNIESNIDDSSNSEVYINEIVDNGVEKTCLSVNYDYEGENRVIYYVYDDNMKAKEYQFKESYEGPYPGSEYKDVAMEELDGLYWARHNDNVIIYDEKGNIKKTYVMKLISDNFYVAGKQVYCQKSYPVDNYYEDFDYTNEGIRYVLKSKKIDMLTGKVTNIKLNYLINEYISSYNDENGKPNYSIANLTLIEDRVLLTDTKDDYLINKDGKIVSSTLGLGLNRFVKLSNGNYYNSETGNLFNSNLKLICNLSALGPIEYEFGIGFAGRINGKYGIINEDGVVALEFIYSRIYYPLSASKSLIVATDEKVFIYYPDRTAKTYLSTTDEFGYYGYGIYTVNKDGNNALYSLNGKFTDLQYEYTESIYTFSSKLGTYKVLRNYDEGYQNQCLYSIRIIK